MAEFWVLYPDHLKGLAMTNDDDAKCCGSDRLRVKGDRIANVGSSFDGARGERVGQGELASLEHCCTLLSGGDIS